MFHPHIESPFGVRPFAERSSRVIPFDRPSSGKGNWPWKGFTQRDIRDTRKLWHFVFRAIDNDYYDVWEIERESEREESERKCAFYELLVFRYINRFDRSSLNPFVQREWMLSTLFESVFGMSQQGHRICDGRTRPEVSVIQYTKHNRKVIYRLTLMDRQVRSVHGHDKTLLKGTKLKNKFIVPYELQLIVIASRKLQRLRELRI